jgi:hypothetical protein
LGVRWNPEVSNQVWMHFKQIWMHWILLGIWWSLMVTQTYRLWKDWCEFQRWQEP